MSIPLSRKERSALARAFRSPDPAMRAQAQGTRALIEDRIIETIVSGNSFAYDGATAILILDGETVSLRGLDKRTKAVIDAAVKARRPEGRSAIPVKVDLQNRSAVSAAAYRLGREIAESLQLDHPPECAAPHPGHSSGRCERWPGDSIHGSSDECEEREGEPCANPDAHHAFVGVGRP